MSRKQTNAKTPVREEEVLLNHRFVEVASNGKYLFVKFKQLSPLEFRAVLAGFKDYIPDFWRWWDQASSRWLLSPHAVFSLCSLLDQMNIDAEDALQSYRTREAEYRSARFLKKLSESTPVPPSKRALAYRRRVTAQAAA